MQPRLLDHQIHGQRQLKARRLGRAVGRRSFVFVFLIRDRYPGALHPQVMDQDAPVPQVAQTPVQVQALDDAGAAGGLKAHTAQLDGAAQRAVHLLYPHLQAEPPQVAEQQACPGLGAEHEPDESGQQGQAHRQAQQQPAEPAGG